MSIGTVNGLLAQTLRVVLKRPNGQGATLPTPARRNNVSREELPKGDEYTAGFLEGEDSCDAIDDFSVDFDDRGMSGDPFDGTDWGESDGCLKCGANGCLDEGQWFVFVREERLWSPRLTSRISLVCFKMWLTQI